MGTTPKPIRDKDEPTAGGYTVVDGVLVWIPSKPKAEPKAE